jgi:hypothetical protein
MIRSTLRPWLTFRRRYSLTSMRSSNSLLMSAYGP